MEESACCGNPAPEIAHEREQHRAAYQARNRMSDAPVMQVQLVPSNKKDRRTEAAGLSQ
jgi:hypothetical protein